MKDTLAVAITDWIWREFNILHYRPFALEVFRHGEREVVETVCPTIFLLISVKKDQVSSLNEKGVKTVVLGPGGSDTEIKDAFEGKYKVGVFTKSEGCQVSFEYRSRI